MWCLGLNLQGLVDQCLGTDQLVDCQCHPQVKWVTKSSALFSLSSDAAFGTSLLSLVFVWLLGPYLIPISNLVKVFCCNPRITMKEGEKGGISCQAKWLHSGRKAGQQNQGLCTQFIMGDLVYYGHSYNKKDN